MVSILSSKQCPFCIKLCNLLDTKGITYTELDINLEKNKKLLNKIGDISGTTNIPIVIVNKQIVAPGKSYKTIEQCVEIVEKINK